MAGACAQQPNYLFHRLSIKEGLAQEDPLYSGQDRQGYIWVVAKTMLQRNDGHRFSNFFCGRSGSLPAGIISSALMDTGQNRLWLLIEDKFGYFDTRAQAYRPVKITVPDEYVKSPKKMYIDRRGNIIIIYKYKGIVTYNPKTGDASPGHNPFILPQGWQPHSVCQDDDLNYWISAYEGLVKYNTARKTLSFRGHNAENDPVIRACENDREMGIVYFDKNKRLWVAVFRPRQLFRSFHTVTGEAREWKGMMDSAARSFIDVMGMYESRDGTLWMYGLAIFASVDYGKNSISYFPANSSADYSLRYDEVVHISEDREKSIWLCSNKGLYRFNPSAHLFYTISNRMPGKDLAQHASVTGFLELTDGRLLVSTWGAGVFAYDREMNPVASRFAKGSENNEAMVWCMLQRRNGDVWKGIQEGLLVIDEAAGNKSISKKHEVVNNKTIRQLIEDKSGNVWMGTQQGRLIKWEAATNSFRAVKQFQRAILKLYADSQNNIWACTDNDGVYCVRADDGSVVRHYTSSGAGGTGILVNTATDIVQYDDSTIVIAANGLNVLDLKTGKFSYLDEGLQAFSIVLDREKRLWASTNTGILCRRLPDDNLSFSFDARDGLSNFAFNTGAAILLKNGHIAFGTNHDFVVFDPVKAMDLPFGYADLQVSGMIAGDRSLPVDSVLKLSRLELKHDRNSLVVRFTNNQYQTLQTIYYRLEGKDKEWKPCRPDGEVSLNYLSPGTYTLTAALLDIDKQPVKTISIPFSISAPFYKTWWFYSLIGLALLGLFLWLDRERIRRKEATENIRAKIAGQLHEEVNMALNNINILSEIGKLKAATEPKRALEFMEQIHSRSQNMIIAMDDMLWSIAPENDSMEKSVERMKEYVEALNNRHGIKIELLVDDKVYALKPGMQLRHEAFLLFKESIMGLVEAGVSNCQIHLNAEKSRLLYSMQFNTGSTNMQLLNNLLQRQDLTRRLEAIKATQNVSHHKSNIVIELKVPVGD